MSFRDETLEGTLVEHILQMLHIHHHVKFLIQCLDVGCSHLLDAQALTRCQDRVAGLADLRDAPTLIRHHLHLFLTQLMPDQRQHIVVLLRQHTGDDLWVVEQVAVQEQHPLIAHSRKCKPKGIDIVGGRIHLIVNKLDLQIGVSPGDEILNHRMKITSHKHEIMNAVRDQRIHAPLQEATLPYLQQALGGMCSQRTQTRRHAGG